MSSNNYSVLALMSFGIGLAVVGLAGVGMVLDGRTATLVAYNGFSRGVTVTVGDTSTMIGPREAQTLSVPAGPVEIETTFTGGGEIEFLTPELSDYGRGLVVYNVGNRATLAKAYIVYGRGEVPEGEHITGQITHFPGIDYVFEEPPLEKEMSGSRLVNTQLITTDLDYTHWQNVNYYYTLGEPDAAAAHARAVMREVPVSARVVMAAAEQPAASDDIDAWCRQVIAEVPEGLQRHRYCQNARSDQDAVYDEYAALLATNPESGLHHYLLARISAFDDAGELYTRAIDLDPSLGNAYWALASLRLSTSDDWAGALELLDQAWTVDETLQWETLDTRIRLQKATGKSPTELAAMWADEVGDTSELTGLTYGRMMTLNQDPTGLQAIQSSLTAEFSNGSSGSLAVELGSACLAAQDLACLRSVATDERGFMTFVVLSDAATPEDRAWVFTPGAGASVQNIYGAVHQLREGRDASETLAAIQASDPNIASLLKFPPQTVADATSQLRQVDIAWRPNVWFSLYRLTDNPDFLTKARELALPTDLPITEP